MKSDKTKERENKRTAYKSIDNIRPIGLNCVKIAANNTDKHELMKYMICRQLSKEGKEFITECYFLNGKRADIVVPGDLKIIEILGTETDEQCKLKIRNYPYQFQIIIVKADQEWNEKLIY